MRWRAARAVLAAFLVLAVPAGAAEPSLPKRLIPKDLLGPGIVLGAPLLLNADRLEYDEAAGVFVAEGNVEAGLGGRMIRADRIRYDSRKGEAEFAGRVYYKDQGDEFSFDRIVIDVDRELGVLYNGRIRIATNNYQIASRQFEKTGEQTFVIREGSLTTCPCEPDCDWKFSVGRTRVTIDGYAVGRNVTFRVRDVPVLWLPWAAFPVKVSRQTGLLLPSLANSSSKGAEVILPFYWAASRWSDATLTMDWMSKRGWRPEGEFRFALNPASEAAIRYTQYRDELLRDSRFRASGENLFDAGDGWTVNARWDIASDDRYYRDLVTDDLLRTARHVPSRAFAAVGGGDAVQSLAVHWIEDLQGTPDDNTVQRLPEYTASLLPLTLRRTGVDLSGEVVGTRFDQRAGVQEWRGRASGEASRPLPVYRSIVLTPFAGFDALGDYRGGPASADRGTGRILGEAGASVAGEWSRGFGLEGGRRLIHALRPSVGFRWISEAEQSEIPLTDAWARIAPQRQFTFALAQRLVRLEEGRSPAEVAFLEIEWAYDLAERDRPASPYIDPRLPYYRTLRDQIDLGAGRTPGGNNKASDLYARFMVRPLGPWSFGGETLVDVTEGRVTTAALGGEWERGRGAQEDPRADGAKGKEAERRERTRVLVEYRISRGLSEDVHGIAEFRPFRFLGFRGEGTYSFKLNELSGGKGGVTFHPKSECWSVGISVERKTIPNDTSIQLSFGLRGIGEYGN